jgi:hypothetical protein
MPLVQEPSKLAKEVYRITRTSRARQEVRGVVCFFEKSLQNPTVYKTYFCKLPSFFIFDFIVLTCPTDSPVAA